MPTLLHDDAQSDTGKWISDSMCLQNARGWMTTTTRLLGMNTYMPIMLAVASVILVCMVDGRHSSQLLHLSTTEHMIFIHSPVILAVTAYTCAP